MATLLSYDELLSTVLDVLQTYRTETEPRANTRFASQDLLRKMVKAIRNEQQSSTLPLPKQTIPFTELPAEIRNRIYTYALVSDGAVKFECQNLSTNSKLWAILPPILGNREKRELGKKGNLVIKERIVSQPALTRMSKQIRAESLPIFYGANSFDYVSIRPSTHGCTVKNAACGRWEWLVAIGTQNRLLLRDLTVDAGAQIGVVEDLKKRMAKVGAVVNIVRGEGRHCVFRVQFIDPNEVEEDLKQ